MAMSIPQPKHDYLERSNRRNPESHESGSEEVYLVKPWHMCSVAIASAGEAYCAPDREGYQLHRIPYYCWILIF